MNQLANQSALSLKIQKLKKVIKVLEEFESQESDQVAGVMAQLLKIITELFEEVEQSLKASAKKKQLRVADLEDE